MLDRISALLRAGHDLDARLLLAAHATRIGARHGVGWILVGGSAVDFYTAQTLESVRGNLPGPLRASVDLDVVATATRTGHDATRLREALHDEGFQPLHELAPDAARSWRHPVVPGLVIDVMPHELEGSMSHVRILRVEDTDIQVIGPEDLFIQYLEAAVATRRRHDYTRAVALALTHEDDLDWEYIYDIAPIDIPPKLIEHAREAGPYDDALELS